MSKITVFTKNDCAQCTATKKMMTEKGIEFTEVNVLEDKRALERLKLHGYQSLPVVAVGGLDNSWSGFRPDRIGELAKNES